MGPKITLTKTEVKSESHQQPMTQEVSTCLQIEDYLDQAAMDNEPLYQVKPQEHKHRLHKFVGALLSKNKHQLTVRGSGVLISQDLVLTVAHNVMDDGYRSDNTDIKFYPGLSGSIKDSPFYECTIIYYPEEHKTSKKPQYDYALLKLNKPFLDFDDFIPLTNSITSGRRNFYDKLIAIYGYPSQKYRQLDSLGKNYEICQWGLVKTSKIVEIKEKEMSFFHRISTFAGQSGCPIIEIGEDESLSIVGIHKGSAKATSTNEQKVVVNVGITISTQLIGILQEKALIHQAHLFKKKLLPQNQIDEPGQQKQMLKNPVFQTNIISTSNTVSELSSSMMKKMRTSDSHPIYLDFMDFKWSEKQNKIGITLAPGKYQPAAMTGCWNRDLQKDLQRIKHHYKIDTLVSLLNIDEAAKLKIANQLEQAEQLGIKTYNLPVNENQIPSNPEKYKKLTIEIVDDHLRKGRNVVVHCMGGLNRSPTFVATCLIYAGLPVEQAIKVVQKGRPGSLTASYQRKFLKQLKFS